MYRFIVLLGVLTITLGRPLGASECAPADLILTHGHVITMNRDRRVVSALAVREGRIEAVGIDQAIAACAGPATRRIDLQGRTVLPGLIDVHTHALSWAESIVLGDIDATYPTVHTIAEIKTAVAEHVRTISPGQWVRGQGWDDAKLVERRYLNKDDLDAVAPNVPVYLVHSSGHLAVANRAALKAAGVDRNTPTPPGGVIERDASGEPTGIVKDNAMGLLESRLPADRPDLAFRAAQVVSERAAAVGSRLFTTFRCRPKAFVDTRTPMNSDC
jgi:predicted amidohydrolase YtcJ